jgi:predicted  nucleic acid-binding Zn-ribbon protein
VDAQRVAPHSQAMIGKPTKLTKRAELRRLLDELSAEQQRLIALHSELEAVDAKVSDIIRRIRAIKDT